MIFSMIYFFLNYLIWMLILLIFWESFIECGHFIWLSVFWVWLNQIELLTCPKRETCPCLKNHFGLFRLLWLWASFCFWWLYFYELFSEIGKIIKIQDLYFLLMCSLLFFILFTWLQSYLEKINLISQSCLLIEFIPKFNCTNKYIPLILAHLTIFFYQNWATNMSNYWFIWINL